MGHLFQAKTVHSKTFFNIILGFLGRGCFLLQNTQKVWKKSSGSTGSKMGILFSVMVCFGLVVVRAPTSENQMIETRIPDLYFWLFLRSSARAPISKAVGGTVTTGLF